MQLSDQLTPHVKIKPEVCCPDTRWFYESMQSLLLAADYHLNYSSECLTTKQLEASVTFTMTIVR